MHSCVDGGDLVEETLSLLPYVRSLEELDGEDLSDEGLFFLPRVCSMEELDHFIDCISSTIPVPSNSLEELDHFMDGVSSPVPVSPDIFDISSICLPAYTLSPSAYTILQFPYTGRQSSRVFSWTSSLYGC